MHCAFAQIQLINMEVDAMRELKTEELMYVAGGEGVCTSNDIYGITQPSSLGQDLIAIYEGAVAVTSHIIERVAKTFD
jgi:hypothetical protein